jgi:hypothetical protein
MRLQDSKHTAVSVYLFLLDYTLWHLCTGSLNCYRPLGSVHLELGVGAELTETLCYDCAWLSLTALSTVTRNLWL